MDSKTSSINLTEGKINLGGKNIRAISGENELNALAEEGLIEKRETGRGKLYFYVEAMLDDMRFGVFMSLRDNKLGWLRLQWLDSPIKGWDDVNEDALRDEYRLLINFVKQSVGHGPNKKGNGTRAWHFHWGQLEVSYDVRALQVSIFMLTRWGARQEGWLYE